MYLCPACARVYARAGFCTDDGSALEPAAESRGSRFSPDSLIGRNVGSYRVERLIGSGGMGEVFLGVNPEIGSRVAIKVLAGGTTPGSSGVERFFAEARAVNLIRHEGIVNVIDLARLEDGRPYIVMEYLDGAPLSAHIAELGALPLGTVARLVIEVLDALTAAHAAGITHRDLKPDNIFVTHLGRAKVLDFGIAKLRPEMASLTPETRTGALLGTPHYMSPEQARAQPVDQRSDLYAVGVILFECATGRRPFQAEALYDLLHLHVSAPVPSPSALRPDLPAALETLILRAMEKEPARRFQSAAEMARALEEVTRFLPQTAFAPLSNEVGARGPSFRPGPTLRATAATVSGTSAPLPPRGSPRGSKRVWPLALAAVVLVLGIAGVAGLGGALAVYFGRAAPGSAASAAPSEAPSETPFDPAHFDATGFLPAARRQAQLHYKDAELVTLVATNVKADGSTELTLGKAVAYTFRSPAQSPKLRDPTQLVIDDCMVNVMASVTGVVVSRAPGNCSTPIAPMPRCTVKQIVQRAGLKGSDRAVVQYHAMTGEAIWQVSVTDMPITLRDDC